MSSTWNTLSELVRSLYAQHPDRVAIVDDLGRRHSYRDLEDRSRRIVTWLRGQGVRPDDRVLVVMQNRSEVLELEHAVALGGFVRVTLGPRLHANEVATIIADAEPSAVFVDASWAGTADDVFFRALTVPLVVAGYADSEPLPPASSATRFEDVVTAAPASDDELPSRTADDLAYLLYTSGSTGAPKGVEHTNASIAANIKNTRWALGDVDADDCAVHTAPLAHLSGTVAMAIASAGGSNHLLERFDTERVLDLVETAGVTVIPGVPAQLNSIVDALAARPRDLSGLKRFAYAGSAITPDRLTMALQHFDGKLVQLYGLSESPMPVTALLPADHVDVVGSAGLPRFVAAGRPAPGVRVRIVDDEGGDLPAGERGEILIDSPTKCKGYWRNEEATHELFDGAGFVRGGDIGVLDDDGYLYIVDRKKDMIVSGGFNVYPREVENALSAMPEIAQVAVVGAPHPKWGEQVVAVVVPAPGATVTLEMVQERARAELAGYKIPRRLEVRDQLPTGSTGKILKRVLSDEFWGGAERRVGGQ